jgi:hypothetical protein
LEALGASASGRPTKVQIACDVDIILDDRLTRAGDAAHVRLRITCVGLDAKLRFLLFRDKAGASVARGYGVGTVAAFGKPTWRNAS